ncbi:MAG: alkylmercury lyase family protein [Micromonosporaceae bacterium]
MPQQPDLELNKGDAAAALTPAARRLHLAVLETFAASGNAPSRAATEQVARDLGADPAPLIAELADRDVVAFGEDGEVRAAYPFSPAPTAHRVTWEGGPVGYAMCAIDALGMSAMLGRPVTITTAEPDTGTPITVHVDGDTATWSPDTAVVYAGATADVCCPSVDSTCGSINFFTTPEAARAWAERHPEAPGVVLDQTRALRDGITEFGSLMTA